MVEPAERFMKPKTRLAQKKLGKPRTVPDQLIKAKQSIFLTAIKVAVGIDEKTHTLAFKVFNP
jgi:hypothetical protein